VGIIILIISMIILLWGIWPISTHIRTIPVSPSEMQLPDLEAKLIILLWLI